MIKTQFNVDMEEDSIRSITYCQGLIQQKTWAYVTAEWQVRFLRNSAYLRPTFVHIAHSRGDADADD